ncbi:GPW/gp25 family protein [Pseudonocardia sp.]|uniref:GPW/gp25 family protein n=1 Tax=Pseudonocardia sp. TaxID=60912 RepID=UPI003D106524
MTDLTGRGWAFPVAVDADGRVRTASGDEVVRRSIWTILGTAPGERVMRPDFGCGIHDLVFDVLDAGTASAVAAAVTEALADWEPRIDVVDVRAVPDDADPTRLLIEIDYRVRATNSRLNLVYPFYLA